MRESDVPGLICAGIPAVVLAGLFFYAIFKSLFGTGEPSSDPGKYDEGWLEARARVLERREEKRREREREERERR